MTYLKDAMQGFKLLRLNCGANRHVVTLFSWLCIILLKDLVFTGTVIVSGCDQAGAS